MLAVWATATEITAIIRWTREITDIIRWTSAFFSIMIFFHPEHKSKVQRCRDAHWYSLITNLSTEMLIGIALFRKNQIISNLIEGCWHSDNTWPVRRWPKVAASASSSWLAAPVSYLRPSRRVAAARHHRRRRRRRQHFWSLRFQEEWQRSSIHQLYRVVLGLRDFSPTEFKAHVDFGWIAALNEPWFSEFRALLAAISVSDLIARKVSMPSGRPAQPLYPTIADAISRYFEPCLWWRIFQRRLYL